NSFGHIWGYRNYTTREDSRNNWVVALVSNGEGWHNNHHADQRSAAHGHRWWELDVTYATIVALQLVGLAWDVVQPAENAGEHVIAGPDHRGRATIVDPAIYAAQSVQQYPPRPLAKSLPERTNRSAA